MSEAAISEPDGSDCFVTSACVWLSTGKRAPSDSDLGIFGGKSILHVDSKVADHILDLPVAEQDLNGAKVAGGPIDNRCLRSASYVATTGGITAEDVRDLMVATVEHRFGQVNALLHAIEWLTTMAAEGPL